MLRVHDFGLRRIDTEEAGVEHLDVVDHTFGANVILVRKHGGVDSGRLELLPRKE